MSRSATAKRKRQYRKATKQLNLVSELDALEPIDLSEAAFIRRQAKKQQQAASNGPQNLSMAWDDTSLGVGATQTRDGLLDEKERKDTYYKVYLGNQWVSGCCNVIAKRITSGGWECVEVEQGQGNPDNKAAIDNLLRFENLEEDFQQFLRSIAVDILVFGEAYCELVWSGSVVVGLYVIDAVSMSTHFDKHGTVIKYTQTLERSTQTVDFEPEQIIRWWLPDPRAKKKALSPIEHLKDPVYLEQSMITWVEKFFKQGTRPNYTVELGPDTGVEDAQRYVKFFKENYTGIQNAHVPPVMYGGGKLVESGRGTIDIDFDKGQDKQRDRVLAVYGVPPAELNIIESGNIGGGTGDAQNKSFIFNTVMPIEQIILEKFNYRVVKKGLGVEDWVVKTRHADYRSDEAISAIEDKSVRNGTLTINEARAERGRTPVKGGDEAVIVAGKDILPVQRNAEMADEQRQTAQLSIEMQQTQVEKAKEPTPPPPQIAAPGQQPPDDSSSPQNGNQQQQGDNQQDDSDEQDDNAKEALSILLKDLLERVKESYNPDQPRDSNGRWGSGGGSDFPTQDELDSGRWEPIGGDSMNAGNLSKVTVGDDQYFVKSHADSENVHNEVAAYEAAKAMGTDDSVLPTQLMDDNGQEVTVSPWLEGKTFAEMSQSERADVMGKLSDEEFTKSFAMQYILADADNRNPGNYFVDETGRPKRIDMEMIGQAEDNKTDVSNTLFTLYRAKGLGKGSYGELELHGDSLKKIVSHKPAILHALRSNGVDDYDIEGYGNRIDKLDTLSHGSDLSVGELARIGDSYGDDGGYEE